MNTVLLCGAAVCTPHSRTVSTEFSIWELYSAEYPVPSPHLHHSPDRPSCNCDVSDFDHLRGIIHGPGGIAKEGLLLLLAHKSEELARLGIIITVILTSVPMGCGTHSVPKVVQRNRAVPATRHNCWARSSGSNHSCRLRASNPSR